MCLRVYTCLRIRKAHVDRLGCFANSIGRLRVTRQVGESARVPQLGGARGERAWSNSDTGAFFRFNRQEWWVTLRNRVMAGVGNGKNYIVSRYTAHPASSIRIANEEQSFFRVCAHDRARRR